jgi:hypothetical protein
MVLNALVRQEMAEIAEAARHYQEHGALVMTAVIINGVAAGRPSRTQVTLRAIPQLCSSLDQHWNCCVWLLGVQHQEAG